MPSGFKITTEAWIEMAKIKIGDHIDYSKSIYVNATTKICIICPEHGEIWINPRLDQQEKYYCPKCSGYRKTTADFIREARLKHTEGKYDYSLSIYVGAFDKIKIICLVEDHGVFEISPDNHLHGRGCPKCANIIRGLNSRLTQEEVIQRGNEAHNFKYDYSKVIYTTDREKIEIICPKHDSFWQMPCSHIRGHGCPACVTGFSFQEKAWIVGFLKLPESFLDQTIFFDDGTRCFPDALNRVDKIVWEFNGDWWHGNPKIYSPNRMNKTARKTCGELYQKTLAKEVKLKAAGYQVISIWESDWKQLCIDNNLNHLTGLPI